MKFILGQKLGMTQVFREDGTVVPVTRIKAGPCVVTQVKTKEKDGVDSVQVGYGSQKVFRLSRAEQGHLKGIGDKKSTVRTLKEVNTGEGHGLERGNTFTVGIFETGEKVQVTGKTKGRGFQGVVKRHGFKGSPASHGHKDQLRMPGSIGATDAARVFKGTRMGGHMGDAQVTVKNLEVVEIKPEDNELWVKGAVPGARNGMLLVHTPEGNIEVSVEEVVEEPKVEEAPVAEEKVEETKEGVVAEQKEEVKEEEKPAEAEVKEEKTEEPAEEGKKEEEVKEEPKAEETKEEAN